MLYLAPQEDALNEALAAAEAAARSRVTNGVAMNTLELAHQLKTQTGLQTSAVAQLRQSLRGELVLSGDAGYEQARRVCAQGVPIAVRTKPCGGPGTGLKSRPTETRLPGWAYRTRTGESIRELPDRNYVTTSFEVGAKPGGGGTSRANGVFRRAILTRSH
jgi:hypothetical protein